MPYSILVFNQKPISEIVPEVILSAVTESNYQTLCRQYALDPALIESATTHLRLIGPHIGKVPFFALAYGPAAKRPVLVHLVDLDRSLRAEMAQVWATAPRKLEASLREAKQVVRVDLGRAQLADMGFLLAYELARWAAVSGRGIVRGLDGRWYRLNRYKAFLPVVD